MVWVPSSICKHCAHSWQICSILLLAYSPSFYLRITSARSWHRDTDLRSWYTEVEPATLANSMCRVLSFGTPPPTPSKDIHPPTHPPTHSYTHMFFLSLKWPFGQSWLVQLTLVSNTTKSDFDLCSPYFFLKNTLWLLKRLCLNNNCNHNKKSCPEVLFYC